MYVLKNLVLLFSYLFLFVCGSDRTVHQRVQQIPPTSGTRSEEGSRKLWSMELQYRTN